MRKVFFFGMIFSSLSIFGQNFIIPDIEGNTPQQSFFDLSSAKTQELNTSFTLLPNFPDSQDYGFYTPKYGLVTANLDADPELEIIYGAGITLYAINMDGSSVNGWPQYLNENIVFAPSVGDIDGDNVEDIIVACGTTTTNGGIYAFNLDGSSKPGFPFNDVGVFPMMPVLGDIDGDGDDEIVYSKRVSSNEGYTSVLDGDGTIYNGWPFSMNEFPGSPAAIGDIDNDGNIEIIGESRNLLWVWDKDGNVRTGFPYDLDTNDVILNSYAAPLLVDLDWDGNKEIIFCAHEPGGYVAVVKEDGSSYEGWPVITPSWIYGSAIVADVNGDDTLEVFVAEYTGGNQQIFGFDHHGNVLSGFPIASSSGMANQILVADIDLDGTHELILDNNIEYITGYGEYLAYDVLGDTVQSFPLAVHHNTSFCQPVLADLDHDGNAELIGQGNDLVNQVNYLSVWNTGADLLSMDVINPYYNINRKHNGDLDRSILTGEGNNISESIKEGLFLYPNPAKDFLIINSAIELNNYVIRDGLGKKISQGKALGSQIDIMDLSPGIYYITIDFKESFGNQTKAFLKMPN